MKEIINFNKIKEVYNVYSIYYKIKVCNIIMLIKLTGLIKINF